MKPIVAPATDAQMQIDFRRRQQLHAKTVLRYDPGVKRPTCFLDLSKTTNRRKEIDLLETE
jgi:hypothetical protein